MAGCLPLVAQKRVFKSHRIGCLDQTHGSLVLPRKQHEQWVVGKHPLDLISVVEVAQADMYLGEATFAMKALFESRRFR